MPNQCYAFIFVILMLIMSLHIVILAAGMGKRMRSVVPKILHKVGGLTMFERVIQTAQSLHPDRIHVIVGHASETIRSAYPDLNVNWVHQTAQLGTGHAVLQALPHIPDDAKTLILCADTPLLRPEALQELVTICQPRLDHQPLALLLAIVPNPFGLGRIVRNDQAKIVAIIEEKDANEQQRQITEIYPGICCTSAANLKRWLPQLTQNNAQQEYYLTEIIALAHKDKRPIMSAHLADYQEILGVNDRIQLQDAERILQYRLARELMLSGVTIADAHRIDIRGPLTCAQDVFIDVNTVFIGHVTIGEGCIIEPNCVISNTTIGAGCRILASSVLDGCHIGDHCEVGPFARIRPGTQLNSHCKIGNFVEAKKAVFGKHSKASHLSYLGDVTIGTEVNIGAGTITCNYDGANKHQTVIEDGVHIGSDTQLIAPVTIGANATIGAGSTIRSNAPPNELTLSISQQKTIYGWKRKTKQDAQE